MSIDNHLLRYILKMLNVMSGLMVLVDISMMCLHRRVEMDIEPY
jgi:hypothetical protein